MFVFIDNPAQSAQQQAMSQSQTPHEFCYILLDQMFLDLEFKLEQFYFWITVTQVSFKVLLFIFQLAKIPRFITTSHPHFHVVLPWKKKLHMLQLLRCNKVGTQYNDFKFFELIFLAILLECQSSLVLSTEKPEGSDNFISRKQQWEHR